MKKEMNLLVLYLFIILSITFVSAVSIDPVQVNTEAELYQTCNNCTYCNISQVKNNLGTFLLSDTAFTQQPETYYFHILNSSNTSTIGTYTYCYDCGNNVTGDRKTGCIDFEVSPDGFATDLSKAFVNIIILIFFIGLIATTHHLVKKIDFKRWNDSIVRKYQMRNFVKMVLSALLYNIMKEVYIIYYLLGLPIMLILMNLAYVYNISTIILFMSVLFYIYLFGIIILGIVFFSYVQEWIMSMIDMISDIDFGVETVGGGK